MIPQIRKFRLGKSFVDLQFFLTESQLQRLIDKFSGISVSPDDVQIGLVELFKYLYLSAYSSKSVFFPGNQFIDDLWHSLITETAFYRELCEKIKPNCFIDHSGVYFSDYLKDKSPSDIHEEQCSYLASYYENFGDISKESYECTPLFKSIASRLQVDLDSLNALAKTIAELSRGHNCSERWDVLTENIFLNSKDISSNFITLNHFMTKILSNEEVVKQKNFSPERLQEVFGASIPLGFTLWQHLAAIERLNALDDWKKNNPIQLEKLNSGEEKVGLATTHLANPKGALIKGTSTEGGYLLSGEAPWVCGHRIFDRLLIGFEWNDEVIFALIKFPSIAQSDVEVHQIDLCQMNGMATVKIVFNNLLVLHSELVSRRKKSDSALPRKTSYTMPELGIADRVVKNLQQAVRDSLSPKGLLVKDALVSIENRLIKIRKQEREGMSLDELVPERDNLNRESLRLMSIFMGAKSLLKDSWISRVQTELILMDVVVHSPDSLKNKLSNIIGD